jgi:hypothetical protein
LFWCTERLFKTIIIIFIGEIPQNFQNLRVGNRPLATRLAELAGHERNLLSIILTPYLFSLGIMFVKEVVYRFNEHQGGLQYFNTVSTIFRWRKMQRKEERGSEGDEEIKWERNRKEYDLRKDIRDDVIYY